jgi:hypothetical protein
MSSSDTAGATRQSLTQDWLYALRYWLRGPKGIAVLIVSALVVGAALNWSWLVAVGVAPLLLTVLPCAVMCGLGLCMNRITGGSCSASSSAADRSDTPMANIAPQVTAASESDKRTPVSDTAGASALPDLPIGNAVELAPEEQPEVLKERE